LEIKVYSWTFLRIQTNFQEKRERKTAVRKAGNEKIRRLYEDFTQCLDEKICIRRKLLD